MRGFVAARRFWRTGANRLRRAAWPSALFLIVGVVYDRIHSRDIDAYGGLVHRMPSYALVFMIFMLAAVGLPVMNLHREAIGRSLKKKNDILKRPYKGV